MTTKVTVKTIYNCSLERAFKTPMLCDVSKVHTGFGIMPTFEGGESSIDKVIERIENKYWKIEVSDFKSWMLGFSKFIGEWRTTELKANEILIEYSYTLHSDMTWLYPLNWLFAKTFWRIYMKRVLENVRKMAYNNEPYQYQ